MATTREKAAFLRAEGWKRSRRWFGFWLDPYPDAVTGIKKPRRYSPLHSAFEIASRRKAQRETRRLKAAGWTREKRDQWIRFADGFDFAGLGKMCTVYTKSEALATLETP
jgi:hypothetical protein